MYLAHSGYDFPAFMEADTDAQTSSCIVCPLQVCVSFTYTFYHLRRLMSSFKTTVSLQGMLAD